MTRLAVLCAALLTVAVASLTPAVSASSLPARGRAAVGGDVSWPNCPKGMGMASRRSLGLPMPVPGSQFVVIGLTNGPGHTRNPCLAAQVAWAKARHLWTSAYAVASYPTLAQVRKYGGHGTTMVKLRREGVAQARQNVVALHRAGLRSPMVWVDVEPVHGLPWSRFARLNNAFLDGVFAGYRSAGLRVGVYSYAYGWRQITGGRRLPAYPTWVPSGGAQSASALRRCGQPSFSGGRVVLGQWTVSGRDHNVTCPGVTGTATRPSLMPKLFAST